MASQRGRANFSTPSTVKTSGGSLAVYDPKTSMLSIVSVSVIIIIIGTLTCLYADLALRNKSLNEMNKPVVIEVDCGSKTFKKDPKKEKVKDAMEKESHWTEYNVKLRVHLPKEGLTVDIIEASKKSGTCYCFEVLSHAEKKAEKESDQKDVADAEKEERDNEDDHKAKRQEIIPKEDPSTREENEEPINLHVRKGNPEDYELEELANEIDASVWKKVARKLSIVHPTITAIDMKEIEFYEKKYSMLQEWKQAKGSAATWMKLCQALMDANLRELAEKHCCEKKN